VSAFVKILRFGVATLSGLLPILIYYLYRLSILRFVVCFFSQVYTTHAAEGYGAHVATRDIADGDQILGNYLHGILFMSTHERRTKLLNQVLALHRSRERTPLLGWRESAREGGGREG